jgi:hypothetical protein
MRNFKIQALVLIAFVAGFAASSLFFPTKTIKAAPQSSFGGCVAAVPQQWGQFKGGSAQSGLAFEDREGTIRFLTNIPCGGTPLVALEIRRISANSGSGSN